MAFSAKSANFVKIEKDCTMASMTQDERLQYDESLRKYRDTIGVLEGARIEGLEQGRAEGRAEGEAKGRAEGEAKGRAEGRAEGEAATKLAHAKTLKDLGVAIDIIIKTTGLTAEEIATL